MDFFSGLQKKPVHGEVNTSFSSSRIGTPRTDHSVGLEDVFWRMWIS